MVDEAISSAAAALGYPSVRREQMDAVRAVALGNDVFSSYQLSPASSFPARALASPFAPVGHSRPRASYKRTL